MSRTFHLFSFLFALLIVSACGNSSSSFDSGIADDVEIGGTAQQPVLVETVAKEGLSLHEEQQAPINLNHFAENTNGNLNHILAEGDKAEISNLSPDKITVEGLGKVLAFVDAADFQVQEAAINWQLQLLTFQTKQFSDWESLHRQLQSLTLASQNLKTLWLRDLNSLGVKVTAADWNEESFSENIQGLYAVVSEKFTTIEGQNDLNTQLAKQEIKQLLRASTLSLAGQAFQVTATFDGARFQLGAVTLGSGRSVTIRPALDNSEQVKMLEDRILRETQASNLALQDLNAQYRSSSDLGSQERIAEEILTLQVKLATLSKLASSIAQVTIR